MKIETIEDKVLITLNANMNAYALGKIIEYIQQMENINTLQADLHLKDRYFVFDKCSGFNEYYNLDDSLKFCGDNPIIVDTFDSFFTPPGGFPHRISQFIILDNMGMKTALTKKGWSLKNIETSYKSTSKIEFYVTISDPSATIKRIPFDIQRLSYKDVNSHDLHLIKHAWDCIERVASYASWVEYTDINK